MRMAHRYATAGLLVAGLLTTVSVPSKAQERSYGYQVADQRARIRAHGIRDRSTVRAG